MQSRKIGILSVSCYIISSIMTLVVNAEDITPFQFEETLRADVPVSGSILAGISLSGKIALNGKLKLYALVPAKDHILCVTVKSIDGRYFSISQYKIDTLIPGWVTLKFPSQYIKVLKAYEEGEVSILASAHQKQSNCSSAGEYLLARWRMATDEKDQQVSILINSGRIKSYLRSSVSNGQPVECSEIRSTKLVSYDKVCNLDISDFKTGKWTIIRRRMGKVLPPYYFNIFSETEESEKE